MEGERTECFAISDHLIDYSQNRLEAGLRARVERHIKECPYCAFDVEFWTIFMKLLAKKRSIVEDLKNLAKGNA